MYEFFSQISNILSQPFLNVFYKVSGIPIIAAFVLGLVGALSPCQFSGNLGAITLFGNQSIQKAIPWKKVFFFILGKIVVFSGLGFLVWMLGSEFQQSLTMYFPWIRRLTGPLLLLIGIFMIGLFSTRWTVTVASIPKKFLSDGKMGSFLMGVSFSLGFCPTMFILFFVTLMPMVVSSPVGVVLPSLFAIGTSLPLLLAVVCIWYFNLAEKVIKQKGRKLGKYVQICAGWVMVVIGILDTVTYW
ncbi:sulfite exporter TauE/SafE family protein [Bacillus sp. DJP31]|uniref:urease accessory protein UreH domain-containing protein n=1 Tax=Bacillus sp. DJP31 TaxID=3409789 RepID=UPI003BB7194A